jgi:predicted SnoaL-like aldol condensation-catalyzing enzyme
MTNKEIVVKIYDVIFNGHDLGRAPEFIKENYIQHNPGVETGLTGFIKAFQHHFERFPLFHVEIKHIIAEGDYVVAHLHAKGSPEEVGGAVVDIYRFEDGKVAEHWDVLQRIPSEFSHNNGMF